MALKLPGYEWWPLAGVPGIPFDEWDDPKALVHTTQGSSVEGAVDAYKLYPPHLIVDPWRRRKIQHVDLERAAYALWNADADDSRCYQIEIVGFAEDAPNWSDEILRWLGKELALPLHEYVGVPYRVVWKGFKSPSDVNYILASPSSPLRLTQTELDTFSGWLGHQHIPGDGHWDPSGLNVPKILTYAQEDDVSAEEVWFGKKIGFPGDKYTDFPGVWLPSIDRHASVLRHQLAPRQITLLEQILVAVTGDDVTLDELRQVSREQVPMIVEGINAGLLPVVSAALREVQDMDNIDEAKRTAVELLNLIAERAPSVEDDTPTSATT